MTPVLSVHDTSPIVAGSDAAQALQRSVELARHVDALGYHRHWVAEHHGMRGVASAVPSITIAAIAAATRGLRVGAGGVILPNHTPLDVAEQYGMLHALNPGRIDLALGRALGGTAPTVEALRPRDARTAKDFPAQLDELESYFRHRSPGQARAIPAEGLRPTVWLLGSSTYSAQVAGERGLPYAFAHHLAPDTTVEALALYREHFTPSAHLAGPKALISASVIAGETDEHAEWLAGSTRLKVLSRHHGRPIQLPSPEDAAAYDYTDDDRRIIAEASRSVLCGGPATLRERLGALRAEAEVDEVMVASPIHHHYDRLRSYELLAHALEVPRAA